MPFDKIAAKPDRWKWLTGRHIRTVLDVGANTGQFAAHIHNILPRAIIYSFEPLKDCYQQLAHRMREVSTFTAFNFALGDQDAEREIRRSEYSPSSSLLSMEELHKQAFPFTSKESVQLVTVKRLDNVARDLQLESNLLVKLDVQGYEDKVILGGRETISRALVLIVETSFRPLYRGQMLFDTMFDMLKQMGFAYHGNLDQLLDPRDGSVLQADAIFINERNDIVVHEDVEASSDDPETREWQTRGRPVPPPDRIKHAIVKEYGLKFGLRTFVETGTFQGDMLEATRESFDRIVSIELDAALYEQASRRFAKYEHVNLLKGDSGKLIGDVLRQIEEPCLFWLDAHYSGRYSGVLTARGDRDTPVIEELTHILQHPTDGHVVLIDDARLFDGQNDYPELTRLRELLARTQADWILEVKDDVIRIHALGDIGGCCPLPFITSPKSALYSRCVAEIDGLEYWIRPYDRGEVVLKQTTGDLAAHEAKVLTALHSQPVPRVLGAEVHRGYSMVALRKIPGVPVSVASQDIRSTTATFKTFCLKCLDLLAELRASSIVHRDIRPETLLLVGETPVLIDFHWAVVKGEPSLTAVALGGSGRPSNGTCCDAYAMGTVFEHVKGPRYPAFDLVIGLMTELDEDLRLTDPDTLRVLFEVAAIFANDNRPAASGEGELLDTPEGLGRLKGIIHELLVQIGKRSARLRPDAYSTWVQRLHIATCDITKVIPDASTFILVDADEWDVNDIIGGRRCLPFLERDGQSWGPPPDDDTAIRELERLRERGASFIVFGWPAFWWLDHYTGLAMHLRLGYDCVLKNDRLVVFDLRHRRSMSDPSK